MNNIQEVLNKNRFAVSELLRRYNVPGKVDMKTIERAYNSHGEPFMLKLLNIITPDESSFSELIQPRTGLISSSTTQTALMPMKPAATASEGKAWTFWDKLLNAVGNTGKTIGQFKTDIAKTAGEPDYTPEQIVTQENNKKTLYLVAGGLVAVILLILILKK